MLVAIACAGASGAGADDLPDADSLLARVRAAAGKPPTNFRSVVIGHGTLGDIIETTFRREGDVRTIVKRGPILVQRGRLGGENWQQNANGLTVIVEPDPPQATGEAFTTTVERSSSPDAFVIDRLTRSGTGTRTYVEPVTAQVVRRDQITPTETVTTTYTAFATVDGATTATKWSVTDSRTHDSTDFERTEYTVGMTTPDDVALPPNRQLIEFPEGIARVDLPTTFVGGKIVVHASVMGHPANFFLDTGASSITISPAFAKQLGIATFNPASNAVNAGAYDERQAVVPLLRVGQLAMHDVVVRIVPALANDAGVTGLLGFDFLAELGVRIDYERQSVSVVPGAIFVPPEDRNLIRVDIRLGSLQPMTSALFDGARADRMLIDTGAAGTFLLFDYFARRHPEVFRARAPLDPSMYGVGGPFDVDAWRIRHIDLASIDFADFIGYRVLSKQSYTVNEDGLIGYDLLRNFTVVLDYAHGDIFLTQNHGVAPPDGLLH